VGKRDVKMVKLSHSSHQIEGNR